MMTVGVTHTMGSEDKLQRYVDWMMESGDGLTCKLLSYSAETGDGLEGCDGLILTGGHDVHPSVYGVLPGGSIIGDTDLRRDRFEGRLLDEAISKHLPVLGICRGLQFANAHFGGDLITDLESEGFPPHRSSSGDCRHPVRLLGGSRVLGIAGVETVEVNSSHHQAVRSVAASLRATAWSPDGVVEALELTKPALYPFFLLVQWHPERLVGQDNPLGVGIAKAFIRSIHENVNA